MLNRALLLDRDGVVNVDHGYVVERERFVFVDGIFELARHAADRGFRVVIVTNQSGIARGYYTEAAFLELSEWMRAAFREHGVELAGLFHCPYHPKGPVARYTRDSFWRKPNPGMILDAARRLDLNLSRSVFLGDQATDMQAALTAGVGLRVQLSDTQDGDQAASLTIGRLTDLIPRLR
ncbi:D-glycero-alpha-D-manno-heptose-1,7-bisphosphate 7-phosphatase [Azospirillum brasilense]|uniref:D,D-heptose 1,7-bisphosphate phosphatase n=1 Tax=Azospirillum brasilense TaxID=192 RepID=A0A235H983_AZOBR|nr:HAD family hydrolase [Azospirillum brasilense]OYD82302.1 D-glycero-D-manno-heptose 1,7-bisphosphate phosphatase [Azospirillum brasilense]